MDKLEAALRLMRTSNAEADNEDRVNAAEYVFQNGEDGSEETLEAASQIASEKDSALQVEALKYILEHGED